MNDKDSAPIPGDTKGVAPPEASQDTGGQPDSASQTRISPSDLFDNPDFAEKLRRFIQSDKDRGVNQARNEVGQVRDEVGEVKKELTRIAERLGVSPEKVQEAQRQIDYEENMKYIAELRKQRAPSQEPQGSGTTDLDGAVRGITKAFGLDETDPGVKAVLATITDPSHLGRLTTYALERQKNKPPASPAQIAAPVGGAPVSNAFDDMSNDELALKLRRTSPRDKQAWQDINAELERRVKLEKIT